mmetsp:Transcript_19962/g.28686  ORF Transcript_19962/g.28686 Transcript_19962/m.28686 type:complete len:388 (+) Transcript_19962:41-1204(+)
MASPEQHFNKLELTPAGRPKYKDGEVEIKCVENVRVETDSRCEVLDIGSLLLTNIHIVIIRSQQSRMEAWGLELMRVVIVEDCASFFVPSKRIRIHIENGNKLEFKFLSGQKETTIELIRKTLERKAWTDICSPPKPVVTEAAFSVESAGVSGLMRRQEREHQSVDAVTREALTDLNVLMTRAREVVKVIEKYSAVRFDKSDAQSETSSEMGDANEMEGILQNIGIVSPVTRLTAGRQYHEQLARQIGDLLLLDNRLRRLGGMVTLPDVYCLYNRARGTELVSPDDLLKAASLMQDLRIGLRLRKFKSGVYVLQEDSFNDDVMFNKLVALAQQDPLQGISPAGVSQCLHMSILVAKEQLLLAEQHTLLCRDDTINGIFFFANKFMDV